MIFRTIAYFACFLCSLIAVFRIFNKRTIGSDDRPQTSDGLLKGANYAGERLIVQCLEEMYRRKQGGEDKFGHTHHKSPSTVNQNEILERSSEISKDSLYFVFIGDSRIRQLFFLFLELIPSFDFVSRPLYEQPLRRVSVHEDIHIYSKLYRLVATYHWSPLLLDNEGRDLEGLFDNLLREAFCCRDCVLNNSTTSPLCPDVILIGIAAHHMLPTNKAHEKEYFEKLRALKPLLLKLSERTRVIWLDQYPTLEFYAGSQDHPTHVHAVKMWYYNIKARQILSDGIEIWKEGTYFVDEYIRSCLLNKRRDKWPSGHFICQDYIHPNTSALSELIQLFVNRICYNLEI